jgi:hypothetical protein
MPAGKQLQEDQAYAGTNASVSVRRHQFVICLIIEQTLAHFTSVCSNQKILAYLTGI